MSEKILGILVTAAGVTETEAAELVKTDEGIEELQTKVKAKLADIKKNADGRALKTTRSTVEAALKAKGIENPSFDSLTDHLDELESKSVGEATKGSLSDEEVLKHPAVKKLKNDILAEADRKVEAAKREAETSLEKDRQAFKAEQIEAKASKYVDGLIDELNPDFGKNPTIAANRRKELKHKLIKELKWDAEGDELRLLDEEQELLRDASQNVVKPAEKVREIVTSYYELPVSTHRESPGLTPADAASATANTYNGPKTEDEYNAALLKANTPAERAAINEGWEKNKPETKA
jgi:hypothetical protein